MSYKTSYYLLRLSSFGGIFVFIIGGILMGNGTSWGTLAGNILAVIGYLAISGGMVQAYFFYRCPKCNRRFSLRSSRRPDCCPGCGMRLDFD